MSKYLDFIKRNIFSPYTVLILFLILFIIRFLYLDADPFFFKRLGDVGDEGYWAYNARNAILFNTWIIDDFNQALATAPLYSAMVYLSFKLFGLGYYQLRLVSALLGWSTLVVLYSFLKDTWDKKAALISIIILGFNSVFLMYNRWGLVESSMIFFITLTFYLWHKGDRRTIFYFLSGLAFSLAVLTKITAFYFIPAILILWTFEKIRKNLKLQSIAYFSISLLISLLLSSVLLLIPNWAKLSPFLTSVSEGKPPLTLTSLILHFHFNNFFGLLPIFILLIPVILYLVDLIVRSNMLRSFKASIIERDYIEIIALSWLIGGSIGLLFSDLADRRFLILIIPITIIFTKVLVDRSSFDLNSLSKQLAYLISDSRTYIKLLLALLSIIPIYSFLVVITSIYPFSSFTHHHLSLINGLITSITFVILIYLLLPYNREKIQYNRALIILVSLGCIIAVPLLNLVGTFYTQYTSIFGLQNSLMGWLLLDILAALIVFVYLVTAFVWEKNLLKITPKFTYLLLVIYLILNFTVIGVQLANPTFTIAENSKSIQDYTQKGDVIIGTWSHELSLENEVLPIWYLPNSPFKTINQNISKYHPKFILISAVFNSRSTGLSPSHPQLNQFQNVRLIKRIELCPYPYTNKYRIILYLYKIN